MIQIEEDKPLAGVRILDLVIGPMAAIGRQLAELGADVIHLEPKGGGADRLAGQLAAGISLDFVALNLGKRAGSLEQLEHLLEDADILIAGPDLDMSDVAARFPKLVAMTVSDFGATGRFANWQGSGAVYHALTGELSRSGIPGRPPLLPPGDLAHNCAAVQGTFVVLLAYYNRLESGRGDTLDFSILDGAAQALDPGFGIAGSASAGVPASKLPRGRPEARFMYPILPCKDGYVRLCILAPRQWKGMFEWLGRPEEFADESFNLLQNRFKSKTLLPAISKFFSDKTKFEIEEAGQHHGVPAAAVLELSEALETSHNIERGLFKPVEIAEGLIVPMPNGTVEIDGRRMGPTGSAPQSVKTEIDWLSDKVELELQRDGERPLSGLRVLDLGVIVVGADSSRLLGDQGADVIKVENSAFPDGSRQSRVKELISATFVAGHRNKRSLGLNLRDDEGKKLLKALVEKSDVLMANFKGGTLQSLGLDYDSLKHINPGIIVVDSSAFGPTGPWSKRMGYGPLVRASSGLTMEWQYPDEAGSFSDAITVYPDHVAARIGAIGTLSLLIRRIRSGHGGSVSISQSEVMLSHMATKIAYQALPAEVLGNKPGVQENSSVYACAGDDEWCVVTVRNESDQRAIAGLTGGENLTAWLSEQDPRQAMEVLQAAGVPAGAMLRVSELPDFEYYKERKFFRTVQHPYRDDPHFAEIAPVKSSIMPDPPEIPAPLLGQHTIEIMREVLEINATEIDALIAAGALEQFEMTKEPAL